MNTEENEFWASIHTRFPDIVKAMTSMSTKSYMSVTNLKSGITWWSQRAMDYFELEANYTIRGKEKSTKSIHPDDIDAFRQGFRERSAGKNLDTPWEYRILDGNAYKRISARARLLYDSDGQPYIIVIRYDNYGISDEVDSVTGLYTDPALTRHIARLLSEPKSSALLKIGLNQFSHINVMYGASFSDNILNCVAQVLSHLLKNKGTVYRIYGAKFFICFDSISREELLQLYNEIVSAFSSKIKVDNKRIPIKISGGAIFIEPQMNDVNAVRSRLTYAMNHSRYKHHGELVIFNDEVCGNNEAQFSLISVIHQCATHRFEGFRLFYQPIVDAKTGTICGMEALLRWVLEPYGLVSPGVFMDWLEDDPCIFELGNWILRTALKDLKKLQVKHPGLFVNVNVAAAQLERKEFRESVMKILKETDVSPENLCLELIERCRYLDTGFLKKEIAFFHSKGIKIALDDFGTGNSSLSLALELPFDELKVDMSFIKDIQKKPQNQAMVQSIVDYAKRTNTQTCIEGIENKAVCSYISQFGATWHQGYYYSRPVPIEQFEQLLDTK